MPLNLTEDYVSEGVRCESCAKSNMQIMILCADPGREQQKAIIIFQLPRKSVDKHMKAPLLWDFVLKNSLFFLENSVLFVCVVSAHEPDSNIKPIVRARATFSEV